MSNSTETEKKLKKLIIICSGFIGLVVVLVIIANMAA